MRLLSHLFFFSFESIKLALFRLRYHFKLSVLALLGVVLAVAIVSSASFFAQGVDTVIMRQELASYSESVGKPPLSTRIFAANSSTVPLSVASVEDLNRHIAAAVTDEVDLPVRSMITMLNSGLMQLRYKADDERYPDRKSVADFGLTVLSDVREHIDIVDGQPLDEDPAQSVLDVWIHENRRAEFDIKTGELFDLTGSDAVNPIAVRIAGVWRASDPQNTAYWFTEPDTTLQDRFLVRQSDYIALAEPNLTVGVRAATWYVVLNELAAVPSDADDYVDGFGRATAVVKSYLPNAQMTTPSLSLGKFVGRQTSLATILLGFNMPALILLIYFLGLTSAVIAYWSRRESAILRSRGMTLWGILSLTVAEAIILIIIGLPLGLLVGLGIARGMGYTTSFLAFINRAPLPLSFANLNTPLILATLGVILLVRVWMTALSSGDTVLTQEREHSRPVTSPFWYRRYLDLILIIPAYYGYQQLVQRGTFSALVKEKPEDLFQDPLLIIAPALICVVGALLAMRIFPWLMRLLDLIAERTSILPLHLAFRQLSRYSQSYINPMLLVIIAFTLGIYSHALAASMDQWLIDRISYRTGSDFTFEPFDWALLSDVNRTPGAEWVPLPNEFAALPGVDAAARIGDYRANITVVGGNGNLVPARFIGVDRIDFAKVTWFRRDFGSESLGAMMNRLAVTDDSVLVSEKFLQQNSLQPGDKLSIFVLADAATSLTEQFTVAGTYRYFPTVYEEEKIAVIGNLEYINSFFGLTMPHNLWLKLEPGIKGKQVMKAIPDTGIEAISVQDNAQIISDEIDKMERVGVFGTLTFGFLASAFMAILGLLTHSYSSLNERLFLFSVMRSIGLRRIHVLAQVGLEYTLLIAYAATSGVLIGTAVTRLFVPLFRISGDPGKALPPLLPVLDQSQVIPLVIGFTLCLILLQILIIRTAIYSQLSKALRLGHQ